MTERLTLPDEMPADIHLVLGQHPGRAIRFAEIARLAGQDIPHKAEHEWALLHWHSLRLYLQHGPDKWLDELQKLGEEWVEIARKRIDEKDKQKELSSYWAERAPAEGRTFGPAWYGKYRFQQSKVIKTVNDRDGLVLFTSEQAAVDEAMRAYNKSYSERE